MDYNNHVQKQNENQYDKNDVLSAGIFYASDGFPLVALDTDLKPLSKLWNHYREDRIATVEDLREWIARWPNMRLGMLTGRGSGFIVLRVKPDGPHEELPLTLSYSTPDGSVNMAFLHPGIFHRTSVKVRSAKDILPGVDVIGEDDYVPLPHLPGSADGYEWLCGPGDTDVIGLPFDLIEKIVEDPDYVLTSVPENIRVPEFDRMDSAIGYLTYVADDNGGDDTFNPELLWPQFKRWNTVFNKDPYSEQDLRDMFNITITDLEFKKRIAVQDQDAGKADSKKTKGTQLTRLVALVLDNPRIELFHDELGEAYVHLPVGSHMEVMACSSTSFRRWLSNTYYEASEGTEVPSKETLASAVNLLEGRAIHEGVEHRLYTRIARTPDGTVWYDLGDKDWNAVKITQDGWEIVPIPLLFRRYSHLAPQVKPTKGGHVDEVFDFVNVTDDQQKILFAAHLVSSFIPGWPHPILYVHGTQGSAKSTLSRVVRKLVDPSKMEIVSLPKSEEALIQQLSHSAFIFYDNVSEMSDLIADTFCRAVTGSGFSKRELYTNDDDIVRYVQGIIGINGINLGSNRGDFTERSLLLKLERMPKGSRRQEHELMSAFEAARPRILGAIFDTVSKALALRDDITVEELPRMADFTLWGAAISKALSGRDDLFLEAYRKNIGSQSEEAVSDNVTAMLVIAVAEDEGNAIHCTPEQLFGMFVDQATTARVDLRKLPANPSALMRELNRLKTVLEDIGWLLDSRKSDGRRIVSIRRADTETKDLSL